MIVFYISGHGLGHASRDLEVVKSIVGRRPDARVVIRTSAAPWFFRASAGAIDLQSVEVDTGVVQIDSLRLDEDETARRAAAFYATFDARADAEAALLVRLGASVVAGDVPPLAFAAADRAHVPSIALSNFTWDWIYAAYPQFESIAPGVIALMRAAYSRATRALRLPMHGGFEPMAAVTRDIPLIARHATTARAVTRRSLGVAEGSVMVLASFGGYGLRLPYEEIARKNDFTLVVTGHEYAGAETDTSESRRFADRRGLVIAGDEVRYPDLVAAADVVVSKPGYGIVSECIANGAAFLYTTRGRFAEQAVMMAEMPTVLRCRVISQEDLLAGRWKTAIEALLAQPPPVHRWPTNGAEVAAEEIVGMANG
jgi:L-arabinokinase